MKSYSQVWKTADNAGWMIGRSEVSVVCCEAQGSDKTGVEMLAMVSHPPPTSLSLSLSLSLPLSHLLEAKHRQTSALLVTTGACQTIKHSYGSDRRSDIYRRKTVFTGKYKPSRKRLVFRGGERGGDEEQILNK